MHQPDRPRHILYVILFMETSTKGVASGGERDGSKLSLAERLLVPHFRRKGDLGFHEGPGSPAQLLAPAVQHHGFGQAMVVR